MMTEQSFRRKLLLIKHRQVKVIKFYMLMLKLQRKQQAKLLLPLTSSRTCPSPLLHIALFYSSQLSVYNFGVNNTHGSVLFQVVMGL